MSKYSLRLNAMNMMMSLHETGTIKCGLELKC